MDFREERLHEAVERLTDENQSRLLGLLEALFHVQKEGEPPALEPEAAQQ